MTPDGFDPKTRQLIVAELRTVHVSPDEVQAGLTAIHARMRTDTMAQGTAQVPSRHTAPRAMFHGRRWLAMVGATVAIVALVMGWQSQVFKPLTPASRTASVYSTGNGERGTITLPDGTRIELNTASRLEIPADYADGNREVRLSGEAMFTVTHRAGTPFTVIAGPSVTRVLGTRFLVRHYATDSAAVVAVKEGKVAVASTVLTEQQEISVSQRGLSAISVAEPARFSFTNGVLELPSMTLREAIPELNRWYSADIRIADSVLATRRLAGGFTAGSLDALGEILTLTLDCTVVRNGHVITLYRR